MATPLPLEGDGLIENLFYFLWCKDDFGDGPNIYIPDTVLYKFTQPSAWYFTSLKSGKIKRKSKVNLNNAQIEHTFTKRKCATDIVAYHIYLNDQNNAIIEYFDIAGLQEFLYRREKTQNGILQRFVLPKGTSHATIRAIWSPKICLLERRTNHRNLYDKRYNVYERAVTFDGADVHSRPEPVRGAMLPGEIQRLCEQVVDHVTQVSYHKYRISRMVLHLKCDADDRIWLLWCSSLRLLNLHALTMTQSSCLPTKSPYRQHLDLFQPRPLDIVSDATVPSHIHFSHQHQLENVQRDDKRNGFVICTSCGKHTELPTMLQTTYKAVLEHFTRFLSFLRFRVNEQEQAAIEWPPDERLIQAAGGVGFGILQHMEKPTGGASGAASKSSKTTMTTLTPKELVIPPVIQYLHPNLSVQDFERHRQDPIFLHKQVTVCESCCLVYSDFTTTSLEVNSLRQSASVPLILRPQREITELRRKLDPIDVLEIATRSSPHTGTQSPKSTSKPPASAWKPVTTDEGDGPKLFKQKKLKKKSGLGTLVPSAPQMPLRIDNLEDLATKSPALSVFLQSDESANALELRKREETFFRELYRDKDLDRAHPLHHMLESTTKFAAAKKELEFIKTSMTSEYSKSLSALPDVKKPTKSPYSLIQKLPERPTQVKTTTAAGTPTKSTTTKKKSIPKKQAKAIREEDEHPIAQENARTARFISSRESRAAREYQEFLFAALAEAETQLEETEKLSIVVATQEAPSDSTQSETRADGDYSAQQPPPSAMVYTPIVAEEDSGAKEHAGGAYTPFSIEDAGVNGGAYTPFPTEVIAEEDGGGAYMPLPTVTVDHGAEDGIQTNLPTGLIDTYEWESPPSSTTPDDPAITTEEVEEESQMENTNEIVM